MRLFKEAALKCTRLKEVQRHEYYTHGTKSKAISGDKYCTNEFRNLNIPNKISADLHKKKNTDYFMNSETQGERGGVREKRLTSTVNSFVEAVVTISGPVAELVEVNALFCPDALDVVEGTSDHNLACACRRGNQRVLIPQT